MSKSARIREAMKDNPKATPKEIAEAVGVDVSLVYNVRTIEKKKARAKRAKKGSTTPRRRGRPPKAKANPSGTVVSEAIALIDQAQKIGGNRLLIAAEFLEEFGTSGAKFDQVVDLVGQCGGPTDAKKLATRLSLL